MALTQNRVEAPASDSTPTPSPEQPSRSVLQQLLDQTRWMRTPKFFAAMVAVPIVAFTVLYMTVLKPIKNLASPAVPTAPASEPVKEQRSEDLSSEPTPIPESEPFNPDVDLGPLFVDSIARRGDCRAAGFTFDPNSDQFQAIQEGDISDQFGNKLEQETDPRLLPMGTRLTNSYRIVETQKRMTVTVEKTTSGWRTYSCVIE